METEPNGFKFKVYISQCKRRRRFDGYTVIGYWNQPYTACWWHQLQMKIEEKLVQRTWDLPEECGLERLRNVFGSPLCSWEKSLFCTAEHLQLQPKKMTQRSNLPVIKSWNYHVRNRSHIFIHSVQVERKWTALRFNLISWWHFYLFFFWIGCNIRTHKNRCGKEILESDAR